MSAPDLPSYSPSLTPDLISFTNAHSLMAQAGSMFALCSLTVLLRSYVRIVVLRSFGADDWTILFAFALALATFICYVLEVRQGLGKHILVIQTNKAAYRELLKIREIHMCCVTIGLSVVKISVSLLFLRLTTRKTYRLFLWGVIVFMVAFGIASAGTLVFQCSPVQAGWDIRLRPPPAGKGNARCFSREVFAQIGLFNSIVNIVTDFLLALLPIPLIWHLQVNTRTKVSLIAILSLGLFACVAGIMKSTYNKTILTDPRRFIHDKYSIWNFIELDVGIVAASLPALKPLFVRFFEVARGLSSGQKTNGHNGIKTLRYYQHKDALTSDAKPDALRKWMRNSVRNLTLSSIAGERAFWNMAGAQRSEDSILPLRDLISKSDGIVVTRGFKIEMR